jgi:hypothetical protein
VTLDHLREIALISLSQAQRSTTMIVERTERLMGGAVTIEHRRHHGNTHSIEVTSAPDSFTVSTARFGMNDILRYALDHAGEPGMTAKELFRVLMKRFHFN